MTGNDDTDVRVSTTPTIFGEKAALRIIYKHDSNLDKFRLGFTEKDTERISGMFQNPYGALLVTGPTGCGKSTTVATFLNELNTEDVNIVTIEDPVEHVLPGVNQINVNQKAGFTFANALRSILRQDPDILMVGEIRDAETARLAVQAAVTGHLMISTLHTYDALSAVSRLLDMGVERYLLAAVLRGIISQRLVRRVCEHCATQEAIMPLHARLLDIPGDTIVTKGSGCPRCGGTGYKGRFAVYEYISINDEFAGMIETGADNTKIKAYLEQNGFVPMVANAVDAVNGGLTTTEEVIKNVLFV
jgi:type IV pilus assembly protein PilB